MYVHLFLVDLLVDLGSHEFRTKRNYLPGFDEQVKSTAKVATARTLAPRGTASVVELEHLPTPASRHTFTCRWLLLVLA